ncbi:MAG: hypothetical protein LQ351_005366 [Letrouitia transgressa]|nr:MAG: hypothetical protein LQ351_005366 [Letrouitia transgressa]
MDQDEFKPPAPESRVLIIMTGGTIAMERSPDGYVPARGFLNSCLAPRPSFNDGTGSRDVDVMVDESRTAPHCSLRTPLSAYQKHVRYAVLEFKVLLDSSSIDSHGWTEIAQTIFNNYKLFDGFVVLHGTDSLAYTCSALSFILQNLGKPVILTGSQAPMLELQNDATDNLLGSLIIAGHFMIPEVCLFFNYKLFRGNRATKISASDFSAFASPNMQPLATITSSKTLVSWDLVNRSTTIKPFSVQVHDDSAHVACLRIFPGIKPEMVDAVLNLEGLRGLVLETFGAGNAPGGPDGAMTRVLAAAIKRGIIIVNVTQCKFTKPARSLQPMLTSLGMTGSVTPLYQPAMLLSRAGVVPGHDMTSEAALTKLSYLLGQDGLSSEEVARQMSVSLRGELTEQSAMTFEHPVQQFSGRIADLTAIGYAIARGDINKVHEILEGRLGWSLSEADYSGNTPLHIAATGPSLEVLETLLLRGASVHIRNQAGRTPLFLAANAGLVDHVRLLQASGAHLHADELSTAKLHAQRNPTVWRLAGVRTSMA